MPIFANPAPGLADVAHVFEEGAQAGGLELDAELCRDIAAAIRDAAEIIVMLAGTLEANSLLERAVVPVAVPPGRRRTEAERRRLAALAVSVDPDRRIVRFPTPPQPVAVTE